MTHKIDPLPPEDQALAQRMGFQDHPPPRRTDAVFVARVKHAVERNRQRRALPTLPLAGALACSALLFALGQTPPASGAGSTEELALLAFEALEAESFLTPALDDESLIFAAQDTWAQRLSPDIPTAQEAKDSQDSEGSKDTTIDEDTLGGGAFDGDEDGPLFAFYDDTELLALDSALDL